MTARSREEILERYRDIVVLDTRPDWMDDDTYQIISSGELQDIDDEPTGWLATLLAARTEDLG